MMTYGTIPTEPLPSSNGDFISQAREQIESCFGIQRPWLEMILGDLTLPSSSNQTLQRIRANVAFFRMNYTIIILAIIFLSLAWHPVIFITFVLIIAGWLGLYLLRDRHLVVAGYEINQRYLMAALSVATALVLVFTEVKYNITKTLSIGLAFVLIHGALREPEDIFIVDDEEGQPSGSAPPLKVALKNAASSSFTLSQ